MTEFPTEQDEVNHRAETLPRTAMAPGVSWEVTTTAQEKAKGVAKWGESEYARRMKVAKEKADGLKDWREQMLMYVQFESLLLALSPENFAKAEKLSPNKLASVVYKLAGVG